MIPYRMIEAKRDGRTLDRSDLEAFFEAYLDGRVHDYQVAALLMAIFFRGMEPAELDALVAVMIDSGQVLELGHLAGFRVDKHSTGGVGDKVSLALAPLAAELGLYVPMMSGRGLGHTGGTLDKLEAIPGFRTDLPLERAVALVEAEGLALIGQTDEIAPLDRRLYDLRSVTGTVPAIPLIAASIMSKKLAEGLDGLVLDVKVGEGAFIGEEDRALELARTMVRIGSARDVPTVALLTAMDRPLGRAVGNALETREAVECLRGGGPDDLREVVVALAAEMLLLGGDSDRGDARRRASAALDDGRAAERFRRVIAAQGGEPEVVDRPELLPEAPEQATVEATRDGWVHGVTPTTLGYGVVELGGGRTRLGDTIDPSVGFRLAVRPGRRVRPGEPLGEVHAATPGDLERGREVLREAVAIRDSEPGEGVVRPLVSHRVTEGGTEPLS